MGYQILSFDPYFQIGEVLVSRGKNLGEKIDYKPANNKILLQITPEEIIEFPGITHRLANSARPFIKVNDIKTNEYYYQQNLMFHTFIAKQVGKCTFHLWNEEKNCFGPSDKTDTDHTLYFIEITELETPVEIKMYK